MNEDYPKFWAKKIGFTPIGNETKERNITRET